jgi:hypothetical protein
MHKILFIYVFIYLYTLFYFDKANNDLSYLKN